MTDHDDANVQLRPSDGWLSLEEAIAFTIGAASTAWIGDQASDMEFDTAKAKELSIELQHFITTKFDSTLNPNRSKGEKIVADCLLHDEPFFVFRGRDIFTLMVIRRYLRSLEEIGPDDPDMQASVVDWLNNLRKWQAAHIGYVRYPD